MSHYVNVYYTHRASLTRCGLLRTVRALLGRAKQAASFLLVKIVCRSSAKEDRIVCHIVAAFEIEGER